MFQNSDIAEVIRSYEKWTGRRVIYNAQLIGPVKIEISEPLPYSEAAKIVEMVLLMNGFALTPAEPGPGEDPKNPKIWKITGIGGNPKQAGIPFIEREESLPEGEQVVMFLFKLKWADPTELSATISQGILAPAQAGYTSVIPLPKSNSLLVTENTALIRTLIRIVRAIDVEPAEVVSKFITLQNAQAEDIVANLEKLFEKTQQPSGGGAAQPRVQRVVTNAQGQPVPPAGNAAIGGSQEGSVSIEINGGNSAAFGPTEDNIIIGKVRITPDKRTNRIHVVSRPVNMKLITQLIQEYDADVKLPESLVRPLRYRPVTEVIDSVVAAIKDPGDKDGGAGTGGANRPAGQRPGVTQNTNNQQTGNNRFGNSGGLDGGSNAGALGESLSTNEQPTNPTSQQVGKSTVIADPWSNSIIVVGTAEVKQKVSALLDELDVRQPQVMIQVIIGELTLKKNEQFGLDYILRNGGVITSSGVGAGTGTPINPGTGGGTGGGGTTAAGGVVGYNQSGQPVLNLNNLLTQQNITKILAAGSGGLSGFVAGSDAFTATLTALETSNRFRVITTPRIFTTNNKRAIITSGEEVAVPTNIQSQFTGTGATANGITSNSSIQFKPIELRLEVLPLVNSEKEVSLEIVQNVSERAGTTRIDNNDIPNVSRRALKTYVTVPNNGTLILGGLIKDSQDRTKGGINGLVNLPLIGPLFGKTTKDRTRTELIIMMRPVVTMNPPEAVGLREKTMQSFNIPPDLDAAIMPDGIRETIPRAKVVRPAPRATVPSLRNR